MSVQTFPFTISAGVLKKVASGSESLEINDDTTKVPLVSDPIGTTGVLRSKGKVNSVAGVTNFGLTKVFSNSTKY
jgi:hypothetical protein